MDSALYNCPEEAIRRDAEARDSDVSGVLIQENEEKLQSVDAVRYHTKPASCFITP